MAPNFKLTYFPIRGLAEPIRFLLKYADIEFEDDRLDHENWPNLKPTMPFGQVPVLTANGKVYHQSAAILRFCAKQAKLVGKDDYEDMEIDGVVDTFNDLRLKITLYYYESDAAIKESRKEPLFNDTLPFYMERLEKIAKDNNGHLACGKLTWADMYFAALLETLSYAVGFDLVEKYPSLADVAKNVYEVPSIKKWLAERPKTDF